MNASDVVLACGTLVVFPVRLTADGRKVPLTARGFLDASRDPYAIAEWWSRWPDALVGIPTEENALVVVDVDVPGGRAWYDDNRGRLACKFMSRTRSGGIHLYYRAPSGRSFTSIVGRLAPKVDVRSRGAFVVGWWLARFEHQGRVEDVELPPPWLLEELERVAGERSSDFAEPIVGTIGAGLRNVALTSLAGSMRDRGCEHDEIAALLRVANAKRCVPPLGERELLAIVRSVTRYAPGSAWWAVTDAEDQAAAEWAAAQGEAFARWAEQP